MCSERRAADCEEVKKTDATTTRPLKEQSHLRQGWETFEKAFEFLVNIPTYVIEHCKIKVDRKFKGKKTHTRFWKYISWIFYVLESDEIHNLFLKLINLITFIHSYEETFVSCKLSYIAQSSPKVIHPNDEMYYFFFTKKYNFNIRDHFIYLFF